MKSELAERLLATVMQWESSTLAQFGPALQALAEIKYDEYEGYHPGEKFLENLVRWLWQLRTIEEREIAIRFVLEKLVFISRAELEHAIELVYPDIIRPLIRDLVARDGDKLPHMIKSIAGTPEFRALQRKIMIVGLADGAQLDRLRRASPELSHEQFHLVPNMTAAIAQRMKQKLEEALNQLGLPGPAQFQHILLVDDFSGSGFTLIRKDKEKWGGKLIKAKEEIDRHRKTGVIAADASATVILYIASQASLEVIQDQLRNAGLGWQVKVVQVLSNKHIVSDEKIIKLCQEYYDPILDDVHKGTAVLGFRNSALPLVLSHNSPNNSISLLWGDTNHREGGRPFSALFPRYERHHSDRP